MEFKPVPIEELLSGFDNFELVGTADHNISNIASISEANSGTLTWLKPGKSDKDTLIESTAAGFIVMHRDEKYVPKTGQVFIKVDDPKLFYVKVLTRLLRSGEKAGIHPTSVIDPGAVIHPTVQIGPFCVVEKCEIGEGTVIESHCRIGWGTTIGSHVKIASGVVIGSDGYGYVDDVDGSRIKFPHIGGVLIGNHVDIGANTCIDRGTLGNTIIKDGAKIDNLVHVAHNVIIGKNAAVIANAMIGGSTEIGDGAWIAPSATLRNGISIGASSTVGLAALVTKSVPDNEVWAGFPAKPLPKKE